MGNQLLRGAQVVKTAVNGGKGYEHGCPFADDQTDDREADGRGITVCPVYGIDKVNASYAHDLFRKLRKGRNRSFPNTIKIAVNTGMNRCHRD